MKKLVYGIMTAALLAVAASAIGATGLAYAGPKQGYVIRQDLALWQDEWGGKLKFIESLTLGDLVTLTGQVSKFTQDGNEREYVRVKSLSGKEGWARSSYIVSNATLGVVKVAKSVIYTEARDVKVTSRFIGNFTVVAVFKDGGNGDFLKVSAWDGSLELLQDGVFVSKDDITLEDFDVNAAVLYRVALSTKKPELRKNLLNVALSKYGKTMFADVIQAAMNPEPIAPSKAVVPAAGKYLINDNNVNVRNAPDEKTGTVIKALSKNTAVEVVQATAASYTIAGTTAQWFKLKDLDGWVFGAFLSPAP